MWRLTSLGRKGGLAMPITFGRLKAIRKSEALAGALYFVPVSGDSGLIYAIVGGETLVFEDGTFVRVYQTFDDDSLVVLIKHGSVKGLVAFYGERNEISLARDKAIGPGVRLRND